MTTNSSRAIGARKPRHDFPLFPHATGRWAKKVRGKLHYFGKTEGDPKGEAAERLWDQQKDDLYAGRVPRGKREGFAVGDLCNNFLLSADQYRHREKVPLWPETIKALKGVIAARRQPADKAHEGLVFLTRLGQPWVRFELSETKNEKGKIEVAGKADDAIAKSMAKLLKNLGIYRKRVTFFALRHTFETIAGGCRDQVAVDVVMGHVDATMAAEESSLPFPNWSNCRARGR